MPTNLPPIKKPEQTPPVNLTYLFVENIVTLIVMVCLILGLAAVFHSWHCMWGLLLLGNLNKYPGVGSNDDN